MSDVAGINDGETYIDIEEGLKRVMNNKKLYVKLLGKFRDETRLDDLLADIAGGGMEDARVKAHTLKGVSANLSLKYLFLKVQELEAQIKEGRADPALVETVKTAFSRTLDDIEKVIVQYGNA
ncbi:MAG: Hpt domain-containing protein [Spirochaetaceae bacterium]|jgi:HPt (histidine-containing phosphotransfer) domain-containing protein|nr:Hpt domain-containing protein [Spirochaetaceae bacterium]